MGPLIKNRKRENMAAYRLLDHTADLGFECSAKSLAALFEAAILALSDIVARLDSITATETVTLRVRGTDDVARLHALLEEVLFLFDTRGFLPREALVQISGEEVAATLRGRTIDRGTHPIERVVKAVTYHELRVEKKRRGYEARVILDL